MTHTKYNQSGRAPQDRSLIDSTQANQWTVTPKQQSFVEYWLSSDSTSFGNAYKSAIRAGYSHHYAKVITSQHTNLLWVREARRMLVTLQPDHITYQLQKIAMNASDISDRLSALDKLARIHGMYTHRLDSTSYTIINSVPRPSSDAVSL